MKTPHAHHRIPTLLPLVAALLSAIPAHAQLSVQWITQYGTNADDFGQAITVDALGRSWVSGNTAGSLGGSNAGSYDIFLSRLSPGGGVDFTVQRGGTNGDLGLGVALVGSGTVFVGGSTLSNSMDGQASFGLLDSLVARYDTSGNWQETRRFGGSTDDFTYALAGNATHLLAGGYTLSSFDGQTNAGGNDAFLSKRDSTGALVWTRFVGTSGSDYGRGAAYDGTGNGYLAGFTVGSFSGFTNAGANDVFLARYDSAGNRTLLKQIGTNGDDSAYDVEVDASGNIYLTGFTAGALGGRTNNGGNDAFLMKLDSTGNVLWTRLLGGSGSDQSYGLSLDGAGHVWIGGRSNSTFGGHTNVGGYDAFVAEYDSIGLLLGTTFLSSLGDDVVNGLTMGPDGTAYLTGYTTGALGGPAVGGYDVFVAKITGVPEPAAALLLAGAGAGLLLRRRRAAGR